MKEIQNDCVGCETCIHCGRKKDYPVWCCDKCGDYEELYDYDGKELCGDCLLLEMISDGAITVVDGSQYQ